MSRLARRPRRRFRHVARRDRRAGAGEPRIRSTPRQGGQPHLQPRTRSGARHVPAGRGRGSAGRRRLPGPGRLALAEHHLPPRQHDRGRLPRSPQQTEHQPAAEPAAGGRGRVPRRHRQGNRARPSAHRQEPEGRRRALPARRRRRLAGVLHRDGGRERDGRVPRGARGVRRRGSRRSCSSRSARTPGSSSAPIGTSWRPCRCRCG